MDITTDQCVLTDVIDSENYKLSKLMRGEKLLSVVIQYPTDHNDLIVVSNKNDAIVICNYLIESFDIIANLS